MILFILLVLTSVHWTEQHLTYPINYCQLAAVCIHDHTTVCAAAEDGCSRKTFLDQCDMYEYNCDFGARCTVIRCGEEKYSKWAATISNYNTVPIDYLENDKETNPFEKSKENFLPCYNRPPYDRPTLWTVKEETKFYTPEEPTFLETSETTVEISTTTASSITNPTLETEPSTSTPPTTTTEFSTLPSTTEASTIPLTTTEQSTTITEPLTTTEPLTATEPSTTIEHSTTTETSTITQPSKTTEQSTTIEPSTTQPTTTTKLSILLEERLPEMNTDPITTVTELIISPPEPESSTRPIYTETSWWYPSWCRDLRCQRPYRWFTTTTRYRKRRFPGYHE